MTMAHTSLLAPGILCRKSKPELVSHFQSLVANSSTEDDATIYQLITTKLLELVHTQAVPPEVFTLWLTLAQRRVPSLIKLALEDTQSQGIRKAGLCALRRALRRPQWRTEGWDAVGAVDGLVELFENSSVRQAKGLAAVLALCLRGRGTEGQQLADKLVQALLSDTRTNSTRGGSARRRPMFSYILPLFYSCSASLLSSHLLPRLLYPLSPIARKVLEVYHPVSLRQIVVESTHGDSSVLQYWLRNLPRKLLSAPQAYEPRFTSHDSLPLDLTPGLLFCFDLLNALHASSTRKDEMSIQVLLEYLAVDAIDEATRRKIPFTSVLALLQLAVKTDYEENLIPPSGTGLHRPLPSTIITAWAVSLLPGVEIEAEYASNLPRSMLSGPSRPDAAHCQELEQLAARCIKSTKPANLRRNYSAFPNAIFKIETIPDRARLPLIKTLCRNLSWIDLDLDHQTVSSERQRRLWFWEAGVFASLPVMDSKWLFERLVQLGLQDCINFKQSGSLADLRWVNPTNWYQNGLLRVKWESEDPTSHDYPEARKYIEKSKEMAHFERDGQERAKWVKLTANLVSLSGSVPICKDIAVWARRFMRDPIFSQKSYWRLLYAAHSDILSCVHFPLSRRPSSLTALSELVEEAHSVLGIHLQTSLMILGEPSCKDYYGLDVAFHILFDITRARIDGLPRLQEQGLGTEAELITVLFDPLMPIILEYERTRIEEGHDRLNSSDGLGFLNFLPCPESRPPQFAIRFLDKLAKERDELWARERYRRDPSVASLSQGWPKGLPVQYLMPVQWVEVAAADPENATYFASRLQDVIFCSPSIARQLVPHETTAIGKCIDSLSFAIDCYVAAPSTTEKPAEKVLKVWNHYTSVLPSTLGHVAQLRDTLLESAHEHKIKGVYKIVGPSVLPSSLPEAEPDAGPVEWDPWPDEKDDDIVDDINAQSEAEDLTILRCRFAAGTDMDINSNNSFERPTPWSNDPDTNESDIWRPNVDVRNLPLPVREALIVSAMLYLDAFAGDSRPLFSEAFPADSSQPRYPPLYLDYDFLDSVDNVVASESTGSVYQETHRGASRGRYRAGYRGRVRRGNRRIHKGRQIRRKGDDATRAALDVLYKLKSTIPPLILQGLANSLLPAFVKLEPSSPKWSAMSRATFKIINLLTRSDTPQVATDLVLKVLQDMPDESSWHRHVLSGGLTNELPPKQVENMFKSFESLILRSVQDQERTNSQPSQSPLVKITTIKMLPQLIGASSSVPPGLSLEILKSLFLECGHIDVRYAALDAIFGIFEKLSAESDAGDTYAEIYNTLVSFSRFTAAPSERKPVSESQWQEAERGGPLPVVHGDRPLWGLFLYEVKRVASVRRQAYVHDIVLPALDESTKQHNRWMNILLGRIRRSEDEKSLTDFGPFRGNVVDEIFKTWGPYLPKSYLRRHREWAMAYRNYSLLQSMNEKLMAQDPEWSETDPARQHWSDYLNRRAVVNPMQCLHDSFKFGMEPFVSDGITYRAIEDEYFARMQQLVREPLDLRSKPSRLYIRYFESSFASLASLSQDVSRKHQNIHGLLERIVQDVESLRTSSRSSHPSGGPKLLPPRFELQTALLPFPHLYPESTERYSEFAQVLCRLVDECTRYPSCTADLRHFENAVGVVKDVDRRSCAVEIGERAMAKQETLAGCWYIQLAWKLFQGAWDVNNDEDEKISRLLDSWKESPVEWVRNIAWRAEAVDTSAS